MASADRDELTELRAQLKQLRRECDRSAGMSAEIIAAFGEAFRRERRVFRKESEAGTADVVSLEKGHVVLPLGIKEQRVAVGAFETARRVAATALCADASEVVTLRVTFERSEVQRVRDLTGESVDEPGRDRTTFLVRLIAGEAKELFEIVPQGEVTEFAVCRVGGEPCVVRLQIGGLAPRSAVTNGERTSTPPAVVVSGNPPSSKGTLWKAQELLREGRPERAMEVALAYATDVERPALALLRATLAAGDDEWLANVNAYLEQFETAPIRLEKTNAPRFLRLSADVPHTVSGGPLVTVLMPAYNAERTLELAASSILKQSWRELELIIVDDCSVDATPEVAHRIARSDPRARVHRNAVNVGPYVSKNIALSMANGAYITCHDADDWAHPQRIEKQVEAIVASGGRARACVSSWLRLDEAGSFCGFTAIGRHSHDGALRLAHVTCMIEAEFMKRYVGHWDSVRFGADGEMLERLERLLGEDLLRLRQLSVLSLDAPRSLTNNAAHGISRSAGLSPTRRAYRDAWRRWHAVLTDGAYIEFPQRARPFAVPDACTVPSAAMDLVCAKRATP